MVLTKTRHSLRQDSRRTVLFKLGAAALTLVTVSGTSACAREKSGADIVYKTPTCGCCTAWTEHLKSSGFDFRIVSLDDLSPIRKQLGAPADLASCHIATIGGYVVEGHVPADAIRQLLEERPDAVGVFVPGMPLGSPGMESRYPAQAFDVILLKKDQSRMVFRSYGP
jgi:hypothetical protein